VMLSVIAEIATNYFVVRGLQRQLAMTERDIEVLKEVESISQAQAESGLVTGLDVALAHGERESFEARLPNLEAEIMARIYRISILTGHAPEYHVKSHQGKPAYGYANGSGTARPALGYPQASP
ncbi:MAG: TolC family protein, partial [Zetaproteobacteria bacterium]|nr:TolC family protein [Zetaproteobacteria bacterium]